MPKRSKIGTNGRRPILNFRSVCVLAIGLLMVICSEFFFPDGNLHPVAELAKLLLQEIGFALIVALIIWCGFEYFSHVESEDEWNERIEKISKSVFFGVFRRNFPEALIREANTLLLEQTFIRRGCHVSYTLRDDTFKDEKGNAQPFVRLEAVARFKIQNISNTSASLPIAIGLPNPIQEDLKTKCAVIGATIKRNGKATVCDLKEAEQKFREELKNDLEYQVAFRLPEVTLDPQEEIEVIWDYVMAKEEEDTEIFQTRYPTDSISITVLDTSPSKRFVRARSIHPVQLDNDSSAQSKGTYNYRLDRYLLPHQGFAIWWKQVHTTA
jgi:hypothetical protein